MLDRIRMLCLACAISAVAVTAKDAGAQGHEAHGGHNAPAAPYAGLQDRDIKALSAEEVAGLERGERMGFALAAELNGIPGPRHVLELGEELGLTVEQRRAVESVHERMLAEARELEARVLQLERELDRRFAQGHATPGEVLRLTNGIGEVRGRLRAAHLNAHLETVELLSAGQVEAYARLRGYAP